MSEHDGARWTAFAGSRLIRAGAPAEVAVAAKAVVDANQPVSVLVFDDAGRLVDVDFRGSSADVAARVAPDDAGGAVSVDATSFDDASPYREGLTPRGRGRPKLGVVAREVTLLPRHWDWLA